MATTAIEHPALQLFTELLSVPSPSGQEGRLAQIIRGKLEGWGYTPQTDHAGNVTVRVAGQRADGPLVAIDAHMDEIGLIVTGVEADGTVRVERSGGLFPHKLGEGPIEIIGDADNVTGVVCMGSGHAAGGGQQVTWEQVRVLTGRTVEQLRAAGVRPGVSAVPTRERCGPVILGEGPDPLVAAWTFDDRMGCVALLRLLETLQREHMQPVCPLLAIFTVREEAGGMGAKVVALREKPDVLIALDGCPMPPGAPLLLDGRPGIWTRDRETPYDQGLVRDLCRAALEAGTELQPVAYSTGATDASLVFAVGGAQRIACFGQPREGSHGYEVARLSVFDNMLKTLVRFVTTWGGA